MLGEVIAEVVTMSKVLNGLVEEFGRVHVLDTPIFDSGLTGLAVGVAINHTQLFKGAQGWRTEEMRGKRIAVELCLIHKSTRCSCSPSKDARTEPATRAPTMITS